MKYGTRVELISDRPEAGLAAGDRGRVNDSLGDDVPFVKFDNGSNTAISVNALREIEEADVGDASSERELASFCKGDLDISVPVTAEQAARIAAIMLEGATHAE